MEGAAPENERGILRAEAGPMNNKAFFQIIAFIAFVVAIVFLFRGDGPNLHYRVLLTGGLFVVSAALSLLVDRTERGGGDAK
jgi:hypothetical protein